MHKLNLVPSILIVFILSACGASNSKNTEKSESEPIQEVAKPVEATYNAIETIELVIEGNDMMQFNLNELKVTEGQKVKLILKHVGKMSKEVMGHNWVLLNIGTEVAIFGAAAVAAKETDYIPADLKDQVIANTKVIGGSEETFIEFIAPSVGYYDFICSFPGHYGVMRGSFVVQPK